MPREELEREVYNLRQRNIALEKPRELRTTGIQFDDGNSYMLPYRIENGEVVDSLGKPLPYDDRFKAMFVRCTELSYKYYLFNREEGYKYVNVRCELESCKHNKKIIKEEIGQCTNPKTVIWRKEPYADCYCDSYEID